MTGTRDKHLIIGAGFVGLGMAKAMRAAGLPYDQVEATDGIGGNWRHGVYPHVHIISSKRTTEYTDFPMPPDYPDFPSAPQMLAYLQSYADHFGLTSAIEFRKTVVRAWPSPDERWNVEFQDGERRLYKGLLVCNGHHWDPRHPDLLGSFTGHYLHSKEYKDESILAGKRVLVIGGGNSACDIACDAARVAAETTLCLREGVWFLPKTIMGRPTVEYAKPWVPVPLQRLSLRLLLRLSIGPYERYGLPKPKHKIFERHPTVSSLILYYLKHGRVHVVPAIARTSGNTVEFVDGTKKEFDVIVAATGYNVSFPFLPEGLVKIENAIPQIPHGTLHPRYRGLYLIGWGQVRYGVGPLITAGAPVVCETIKTQDKLRWPIGAVLERLGYRPPKSHLMDPMRALREYRRAFWGLKLLPLVEKVLFRHRTPDPLTTSEFRFASNDGPARFY